MKNLISKSFQTNTTSASWFLFLYRVLIGLFFFASGYNKLFTEAGQAIMLETITKAGIPFPEYMAWFVASVELGAGALLAIGFLSRFSALALWVISFVAMIKVGIYSIPAGIDLLTWYSWLLYLPETLYMILLLVIVVQGSGTLGLDHLIGKREKLRRYY